MIYISNSLLTYSICLIIILGVIIRGWKKQKNLIYILAQCGRMGIIFFMVTKCFLPFPLSLSLNKLSEGFINQFIIDSNIHYYLIFCGLGICFNILSLLSAKHLNKVLINSIVISTIPYIGIILINSIFGNIFHTVDIISLICYLTGLLISKLICTKKISIKRMRYKVQKERTPKVYLDF